MSKRNYRGRKRTATDIVLNKAIGKKIKEARLSRIIFINDGSIETFSRKKYCTQTELANALNPPKTFQQIQKYEKGKNGVSTIILIQIGKFFGKPLEYFTSEATELLGKDNPPDNNSEKTLAPTMVTGLN
tara:strand:- start:1035 stop:1424 length:390 start_codon:yes stop_codon:yes gene_type:complete